MAVRAALAALLFLACTAAAAAPVVVTVGRPAGPGAPVSGRLLLFARPLAEAQAEAKGAPIASVAPNPGRPKAMGLAAMEVHDLAPGGSVEMDADQIAFPAPFSQLPPGAYAVQAVLDVNHHYAYDALEPGDLTSAVETLNFPAGGALTLAQTVPPRGDPWAPPPGAKPDFVARLAHARADTRPIDFVSPALSAFWGRPTHVRGWLLLPPGYDAEPKRRYPTVYWTHGFGGALNGLVGAVSYMDAAMADGSAPPMIWVFLDESGPAGTHEFADSVNNGPWGEALTAELIPELERAWRMDARPSGRFLNGHSSGGWATLWLQTRYPALFCGTWSTSPDPSDFHDFTGPDLYAPGANVYRRPDGSPWPIVRDHGQVLAEMQDFARIEAVEGDYGGQMSSFDWVFSPRGADGRPQPMFDRATGAVDPSVVAYWRENYDIAHRIARDWPRLKPALDGKIHLIVGTADTFYLDGAAHRLQAVLDGLGAKSDFRFLPGRTHMDLYANGGDREALLKAIAWEMYAVARPGSARPAVQPQGAPPR